MNAALMPQREEARIEALLSYALLDTPPETAFDDLAQLAAMICNTPVALVSLVDGTRQWFKSRHGTEVTETPRDIAFCAHAIRGESVFVVSDARHDVRFADNPLVTGEPLIRFYAGAPLVNRDGYALGTLCVIDHEPRELSPAHASALTALARQTVTQMELRRHAMKLQNLLIERERALRERDELEAQLRHVDRLQAVGSLAAGLVREIHGPMEVIAHNLGFVEKSMRSLTGLVDRGMRPDGSLKELFSENVDSIDLAFIEAHLPRALGRCTDGVARIARLTDAVQRFAGTPGEMSRTDINQCLRDTLLVCESDYRFIADVVTDLGDLPPLMANGGDLNQVFRSLVVNAAQAIEATGRRGRITVRSSAEDNAINVRIEDNGCGIETSIRDRVFDPFFTTKTDRMATGQGLAITNAIVVNRYGGRVDFESVAGLGTRFSVYLPFDGPHCES